MKDSEWIEPARHCQNGSDVCLAGNADGICCPDDSCDIDDGMRERDPRLRKYDVLRHPPTPDSGA
jgi:hypothetical protein